MNMVLLTYTGLSHTTMSIQICFIHVYRSILFVYKAPSILELLAPLQNVDTTDTYN